MSRLRLLVLAFLITLCTSAQQFNYVQYDTRDGLPGTTVYDMCQDHDGYMWFATSNGISRFDGTHFKNFTVADGIPDNDVIRLFVDYKNRIWLGTFSKQACYYQQGKFYNSGNSALIRKLKLGNTALNFSEDNKGNVIVSDLYRVYKITSNDSVINLSAFSLFDSLRNVKKIFIWSPNQNGFSITVPGKLYLYRNDSLVLLAHPKLDQDRYVLFKLKPDGSHVEGFAPATLLRASGTGSVSNFLSTVDGAWKVDTVSYTFQEHFLTGKKVSNTLIDNEGNLWFSTLGEGVFRLPSLAFKNLDLKSGLGDPEVFSLSGRRDTIICGLGYSKMKLIVQGCRINSFDYAQYASNSANNASTNKLHTSAILSDGSLMLGFDACLLYGIKNPKENAALFAIKSIAQINNDYVIVGTYNNTYKIDLRNLSVVDTVFHGRSTKVIYKKPYYYVASLDGLFQINEKTLAVKSLGAEHSILRRRINDIAEAKDGTLWIATNDYGVVGFKGGNVVHEVGLSAGLSSEICNCLFIKNNYLYVGTNKGINRINIANEKEKVLIYSASDGLPSNQINAIYIDDSLVYVGTPKGLTYFNETHISSASQCILHFNNIRISGKDYKPSSNLTLSYDDNNIQFDFSAISFKSGGDVLYHYKMVGLDTIWRTTTDNKLIYQTLPSGSYKLRLYATNKFGVISNSYAINFKIKTPFWRSSTAYVLELVSSIWLIGLIFNARNKETRKRITEASSFQRQYAMLEQQALQAQMNPHFIFNCLSSIQQYMLTNEHEKANLYLTGFACLIRQMLYLSGKANIKVSEEIALLRQYLEVEKMRLGEKFTYHFDIENDEEIDLVEMPALFLQPYIERVLENRIADKAGYIEIDCSIIGDKLVFVITETGFSIMRNSVTITEFNREESQATTLTQKRMDLLNQVNENKIYIQEINIYDDEKKLVGQKIVIKLPI